MLRGQRNVLLRRVSLVSVSRLPFDLLVFVFNPQLVLGVAMLVVKLAVQRVLVGVHVVRVVAGAPWQGAREGGRVSSTH